MGQFVAKINVHVPAVRPEHVLASPKEEKESHPVALDSSLSAEASAVACWDVNLKRDSSILIEITPLDSVSKRTA